MFIKCCAMIRWITSERDRPSSWAISSRPTICPSVTKVTIRWERASFTVRLGLPPRFDLSAVRCFASMMCSSKGFLGTCQLKWHQEGPLVLLGRIQLQIVRKGMVHSHDRAGYFQMVHIPYFRVKVKGALAKIRKLGNLFFEFSDVKRAIRTNGPYPQLWGL
jgi:hypothetical protein